MTTCSLTVRFRHLLARLLVALLLTPCLTAAAQAQVFPPTADDDIASASPATSTEIHVLNNDWGGSFPIDPTSVELLSFPPEGSASVNAATGVVTYTSTTTTSGAVSFTYGVRDTEGNPSNVATITVCVMNMPPQADDDTAWVSYSGSVTVAVLSNDQGGSAPLDPATLEIATPPTRGSVSVNPINGEVQYTPSGAQPGGDSFQYRVSNMYGFTSNVATVNIMISNYPPQINNFHGTLQPGSGNYWKFEGWVLDECPGACLVQLTQGITAEVTPDADGYFVCVRSMPNQYGMVSATAADSAGQSSPVATAMYYAYWY